MPDQQPSSHLPSLVVCGHSHGGTTLVAELVRNTERYDTCFGCGFLLCGKPFQLATLKPYNSIVPFVWHLKPADFAAICDAADHEEMYALLKERSPHFDKRCLLFDKTPDYLTRLCDVYRRSPHARYVIVVRNPKPLYCSRLKKHPQLSVSAFTSRYLEEYHEYQRAKALIPEAQRMVIHHERLCADPERGVRHLCDFLGIPFESRFLDLSRKKFGDKVRHQTIDSATTSEYRTRLNPEVQRQIQLETSTAIEFLTPEDGVHPPLNPTESNP